LSEIDRQANNVGLGDQNKGQRHRPAGVYRRRPELRREFFGGVNLSNQSVSSTGLGLAGTSVLTTLPR
jgi:hypothetical protein